MKTKMMIAGAALMLSNFASAASTGGGVTSQSVREIEAVISPDGMTADTARARTLPGLGQDVAVMMRKPAAGNANNISSSLGDTVKPKIKCALKADSSGEVHTCLTSSETAGALASNIDDTYFGVSDDMLRTLRANPETNADGIRATRETIAVVLAYTYAVKKKLETAELHAVPNSAIALGKVVQELAAQLVLCNDFKNRFSDAELAAQGKTKDDILKCTDTTLE